jgi:hypothetical protein
MKYVAAILPLIMLSVPLSAMAQQDSAHTRFTPNAPDAGRSGQVVQLPQGGIGVTTGGTSRYQTLATPGGGSAVAVPNNNGQLNVIQTPGRRMNGTR